MLKDLIEKLAKIGQDMRALYQLTEKEDRGFTAEERDQWDRMLGEYEETEQRIKAAQQAAKLQDVPPGAPNLDDSADEQRSAEPPKTAAEGRALEEYRDAYEIYLRDGAAALKPEQRQMLTDYQASMEIRAQSTTNTEGGYTIPEGFAGYITEVMQDFSGLLGAAGSAGGPELLRTASGNTIPFPTNDDTGNAGLLLSENAAVTEQDTVFGQRTLGAYMFTSRLIRVSLQLLQDEAVNLERYLGNILGKRLGRAMAPYFATGTGSSQPTGLATAATDGGVNVSTAAGLTDADLVAFEHALDPAYRSRGAAWVFNDNTLRDLKLLVDGNSRPLWLPGDAAALAQGGAGPTLKGYRYIIDQGMDDVGTGNRPVCFGDLSEFIIREILGVNLFKFEERYMDNLQKGFMGYARYDSNLIDVAAVVTDIGVA